MHVDIFAKSRRRIVLERNRLERKIDIEQQIIIL